MIKYTWIVRLVKVVDTLFCLCCIFPLSILHWHGTWKLQDEYFFPNDESLSRWLSLAVGSTTCILELLFQPQLQEWLTTSPRVLYIIATRLHLYVQGWAILCFWRGVWEFLNFLLKPSFVLPIAMYMVCQVFMVAMKIVRTAVGVPFSLKLDISADLLEPDLLFKTTHSHIYLFVFDCLISQFLVVTLNIALWWSLESIVGITQVCDNNNFFCLNIGIILSLTILALDIPLITFLNVFNERKRIRLLFEEIIFIFITLVNIFLWINLWDICIKYFLPWKYIGSWVAHWVGTIGLMGLQAFNSVGLHGISRDGEAAKEQSTLFDNMYWRIIFDKHIESYKREYNGLSLSLATNIEQLSDSNSPEGTMDANSKVNNGSVGNCDLKNQLNLNSFLHYNSDASGEASSSSENEISHIEANS